MAGSCNQQRAHPQPVAQRKLKIVYQPAKTSAICQRERKHLRIARASGTLRGMDTNSKPMTKWEADIRESLASKPDAELRRLAREVGIKGGAKMDRAALTEATVKAYCP